MQLAKITMLANMMREIDTSDPVFKRLYDDIFMALVTLGVPADNGVIEIDGETYPASDKVKPLLNSTKKHMQNQRDNPPKGKPVQEKQSIRQDAQPISYAQATPTPQAPETHNVPPVAPAAPVATPPMVPVHAGEKPLIVSKITVKLTKKADQSQYHEVKFLVFPLKVTDNAASCDIAAVMETGDKVHTFVSPPTGGKRSVECQDGEDIFTARGQWRSGRFEAFIHPSQHVTETYKVETKAKVISPAENNESTYATVFSRAVGSDTVYVLPHNKANEPNGVAKTTIVLESSDRRQGFTEKENLISAYLSGTNYRIYGKWEDEGFVIGLDPVG